MDEDPKHPLDDHQRHQLKGCHGNISRKICGKTSKDFV